jgi:hypothetical protein
MKNIIFGAIIAILVLSSLSILAVYYTQNFDEDLNFVNSIDYSELELQKSDKGGVNYLVSAKGKLGKLELENEGIFSQVYRFPELVGCLDVKDSVSNEDLRIRNFKFEISFVKEGITERYGRTIEIPVEGKETYDIIGEYNSYNIPVFVFQESIEKILVYRIPKSNDNPLDGNVRGNYQYKDCNSLERESTPIASFNLVA